MLLRPILKNKDERFSSDRSMFSSCRRFESLTSGIRRAIASRPGFDTRSSTVGFLMETAASLSSLGVGARGRIVGFNMPPDQRQRLLEMGLTVGAEFQVVRFAPMGDPLEIKVRSYRLSLRKREAGGILVEILS